MFVAICEGSKYEQIGIGKTKKEAVQNMVDAIRNFLEQFGSEDQHLGDDEILENYNHFIFNAAKSYSGYLEHLKESK